MSSSSPDRTAEKNAGGTSRRDTPQEKTPPRTPALPSFVRSFTRENTELTGIRISRARSGQQRRLMQIEERDGCRVSGGEVQQWRWKGTIEADGFLYALFPSSPAGTPSSPAPPSSTSLALTTLEPLSRLSGKNPDTALELAETFLYSCSLLSREDEKGALTPEAIFFDNRRAWYFLPPKLSSIISEEMNPEYKKHFISETDQEKRISAAVLFYLYRAFTGHSPADEVETAAAHPHLYTPELTEECARLIFSPFPEGDIPSPEDTLRRITMLRREGWSETLEKEEKLQRMEDAAETLRKEAQQHRIRASIRRYTPPVALGAAALFVLFFLFFPFGRSTAPDPVEGLAPEEVIHLYYDSISSLDHETMDACTAGRREFHYIKEVTNLFVIARVRQGVEHTESFMTAEQWLDKGRPPLSNHTVVYGISDLNIVDQEEPGEEERRYTIEFNKYSTVPVEEEAAVSTGIVEIREITETLTLARTSGGSWKISDIQRIEEDMKERVRPEG